MAASFEAFLHLDGISRLKQAASYRVLTCEYHFSQPTDPRGRPSAGVRSGLIRVSLVGNNYVPLTEWAIQPNKWYNGKLSFKDRKDGTLKVLDFEHCYCVSYREIFTPHDGIDSAYTFDLGLTAAKMHLNGMLHDNQWLDWRFDAE